MYQSLSLCSLILKLYFKAGKNAWPSDLKWCNYIVCPAEGGLLLQFSALLFEIKFVQM